ncbi:MAG: phosphatase [Lentisphaerae bacterium]|nr:phosphatase [Lentisphaerota bacterium]
MQKITENLHVGTIEDYEAVASDDSWHCVIAAKEPMHRKALGYTGRACDKNHPEYLYAERGNAFICNLIDVDDVRYIGKAIIDKAVQYAVSFVLNDYEVLVCCNKGESRSPVVAMLVLKALNYFGDISFEVAEEEFKELYPKYNPRKGMRDFAVAHWDEY